MEFPCTFLGHVLAVIHWKSTFGKTSCSFKRDHIFCKKKEKPCKYANMSLIIQSEVLQTAGYPSTALFQKSIENTLTLNPSFPTWTVHLVLLNSWLCPLLPPYNAKNPTEAVMVTKPWSHFPSSFPPASMILEWDTLSHDSLELLTDIQPL